MASSKGGKGMSELIDMLNGSYSRDKKFVEDETGLFSEQYYYDLKNYLKEHPELIELFMEEGDE